MEKIKMTTPLVEMDGDEMTRILWKLIKDELLTPYIELNTEYYDLGLVHRNETDDQVPVDEDTQVSADDVVADDTEGETDAASEDEAVEETAVEAAEDEAVETAEEEVVEKAAAEI